MEKERLKEMLLDVKPGDFLDIMNHTITEDDIKDFYDLYREFASMETSYNQMVVGRKYFAKNLVEKLSLLKQMSDLIARGMKYQKSHYEDVTRDIEDIGKINIEETEYAKVFEVLRQLASNESVQYEIKTIRFPAYDTSSDYCGAEYIYIGEITILGEKEALSVFESGEKMLYLKKEELESIYHHGNSMVLFGNDAYRTEQLELPKQIIGNFHPLVLYLQKDNLAKAVSAFMKFIKENGADLSHIEVDELVKLLKPVPSKRKNMTLR